MTKQELNQWFTMNRLNKKGLLPSWEYQILIRLNHLVMKVSHEIHNDHMLGEVTNK